MTSFFIKNTTFFSIKIIVIMGISLTYYLLSIFIETNKKNDLLIFDIINDNINGVFKETFDIFIRFKKQLELHEESLTNCKSVNKTKSYIMNIPLLSEIKIPNLGNNIVQITGGKGFKKETLENFTEFFSGDACNLLSHDISGKMMCRFYWNGILSKGMEQTITKMGITIGSLIEELNSVNEKGKTFNEMIQSAPFCVFEAFIEFYYQRAYLVLCDIFSSLRSEKLKSINNLLKIILLLYILIFLILMAFLIYFVYDLKIIFSSFFDFIWIFPSKYISEDENFHREIIKFGQNFY